MGSLFAKQDTPNEADNNYLEEIIIVNDEIEKDYYMKLNNNRPNFIAIDSTHHESTTY